VAVATPARAENALEQLRKHGKDRTVAFCVSPRPQPRGLTRPWERFALLAFEAGPSPGAPQDVALPPPGA
jgi:hypothetical protein